MRKRFSLGIAILVLAVGGVRFASADSVTLGTDHSSYCVPWGCAYANGVSEYQEHYEASFFDLTSPVSINSLTFIIQPGASEIPGEIDSFSVYLSYAANAFLSDTPALGDNVGADNTLFANLTVGPDPVTTTLTVTGNAPFVYDPTEGDLLLDVFVTSASGNGGDGGYLPFETGPPSSGISRNVAHTEADGEPPFANAASALVTQFNYDQTNTTPEPGTLMALGTGLLAMTRLLRRRTTR